MTLPLISIITICYNEKANIEKTCKSIASQQYDALEWIVIDGGSNDGTVDILNNYQSSMAYFISEKDKGIYNAMNKGIQRATGEYLLFLNGGDYLVNNTILNEVFVKKPTGDILYGDICLENGTPYKTLESLHHVTRAFFLAPNSLNHQATFIKRDLFTEYGLYNEIFKYAGDYEWFLRICERAPQAVWTRINTIISVFDRGGMSENRALWGKIFREILLAQKIVGIPLQHRWKASMISHAKRMIFNAYLRYKKITGGTTTQ